MIRRFRRFLWWLRPNTFQTDDDSSVEFVDRRYLRYRERGMVLLIEQELMVDPHDVVFFRKSMEAWEPPHEKGRLDDSDRDRIIDNMRRAFATRRYRLSEYYEGAHVTLPDAD